MMLAEQPALLDDLEAALFPRARMNLPLRGGCCFSGSSIVDSFWAMRSLFLRREKNALGRFLGKYALYGAHRNRDFARKTGKPGGKLDQSSPRVR